MLLPLMRGREGVFVKEVNPGISPLGASAQEIGALRTALELSSDAILFVELPDLRVVYANRAACQILRYSADELVGKVWNDLCSAALEDTLRSKGKTDAAPPVCLLTQFTRRDQTTLPVEISLATVNCEPTCLVVCAARPKRDERPSVQEALHDALTGLPNRRVLVSRLERALQPQRAVGQNCALLFIDLDHFKSVNDTWGHLFGDEVLCAVARRLSASVRPSDLVARFGGDEFVVLIEQVRGRREILNIARRIQREMRAPIETARGPIRVSASIGIVLDSDRRTTLERLIHAADQAMYRAKSLGRAGKFVFCRVNDDDAPTLPNPCDS